MTWNNQHRHRDHDPRHNRHRDHDQVNWDFDQPQPIKMTEELRQQLEGGERLNISFVEHDSAEFEPLLKTSDETTENGEDEVTVVLIASIDRRYHCHHHHNPHLHKVPRKIHMVWIGSVLPEKYWSGPYSFSLLNPGLFYIIL